MTQTRHSKKGVTFDPSTQPSGLTMSEYLPIGIQEFLTPEMSNQTFLSQRKSSDDPTIPSESDLDSSGKLIFEYPLGMPQGHTSSAASAGTSTDHNHPHQASTPGEVEIVQGPFKPSPSRSPAVLNKRQAEYQMRKSLGSLVSSGHFGRLTGEQLIGNLQAIINRYKEHVPASIDRRLVREFFYSQPSIPLKARDKLLAKSVAKRGDAHRSGNPHFGLVMYIGSPVDGEMVVANSDLVNEWHGYMREATSEKVIRKQKGLLTLDDLTQICRAFELPSGRHKLTITYGDYKEDDCSNHYGYAWQSTEYPCTITSCKSYP